MGLKHCAIRPRVPASWISDRDSHLDPRDIGGDERITVDIGIHGVPFTSSAVSAVPAPNWLQVRQREHQARHFFAIH